MTQTSLLSTLDNAAHSTETLLEYARERETILQNVNAANRQRALDSESTIHNNVQELVQLLPGLHIAPQQQVRLFWLFSSLNPD